MALIDSKVLSLYFIFPTLWAGPAPEWRELAILAGRCAFDPRQSIACVDSEGGHSAEGGLLARHCSALTGWTRADQLTSKARRGVDRELTLLSAHLPSPNQLQPTFLKPH